MAGLPARRYPRRAVVLGFLAAVVLFTAGSSGLVVVAGRQPSLPPPQPLAGPPPTRPPASNSTTSTSTTSTTTTSTTTALTPGQSIVTGSVSTLSAAGATGPVLSTPVLITIPVRGQGSAYIYNATVGDQSGETIYWNGGQPLSILGHGGIVPGRVNVTVDGSGSTWYLDGAERRWVAGAYQVDTPVAVGTSGLATAQDSAAFTAGPRTVLVTAGGATLRRRPMALHLIGPGAMQAQGHFTVRSRTRTTTARTLSLAPGSAYVIDLTPTASGPLTITATLQGNLST